MRTIPISRKTLLVAGTVLLLIGFLAWAGEPYKAPCGFRASSLDIAIMGGMIIDGNGSPPLRDGVILIENGKFTAVARRGQISIPRKAKIIDASGKYIIPGLIDGNVHFLLDVSVENLARYEGHFEDLVEKSAQVALRAGVTTCFDTWGPLQPLMNVRDRINREETVGSRMLVAGNIIGFSGPLGRDFNPDASVSSMFRKRVNTLWEENVGPDLRLLRPDEVSQEIRKYVARGPDFLKYGSSGHRDGSVLVFSKEAQQAIVEAGHESELVVDCHTTTVESVRVAVEAGVDILIHADITQHEPIPASIISMIKKKRISCGILPCTRKKDKARLIRFANDPASKLSLESQNLNIARLMEADIPIMMTTDAGILSQDTTADLPSESAIDPLGILGIGHLNWCLAMAERGMRPMDILLCATRNVAKGYHRLDQLGTIERGKAADLVVLDANPLDDIRNLEKVFLVVKDGSIVDQATVQ